MFDNVEEIDTSNFVDIHICFIFVEFFHSSM